MHKDKIYYIPVNLLKFINHAGFDEIISAGTCFGKFTKTKRFRISITCLDYLAKYAKHKVWIKPAGEQAFVYGKNVIRMHLAKITENTATNSNVVVLSLADIPLGFGVTAKSTDECKDLPPTSLIVINQSDIGEYLRSQEIEF